MAVAILVCAVLLACVLLQNTEPEDPFDSWGGKDVK